MFPPGHSVFFHYPIRNLVTARLAFRARNCLVTSVRDLVREPLTPQEFLRRPMIFRGRYLIQGTCPDGSQRQFYLASSLEHFRPSPHRIAFLGLDGRLERVVPISFGAAPRDRIRLARQLIRLERTPPPGIVVRVIVDDLNVIGGGKEQEFPAAARPDEAAA